MSKSKTVAIRLTEEAHEAFKALAEREESTVSFVIRRALREYLEKYVAK